MGRARERAHVEYDGAVRMMTGRLGQLVFQNNGGGPTVRSYRQRIDDPSGRQVRQRQWLGLCVSGWKAWDYGAAPPRPWDIDQGRDGRGPRQWWLGTQMRTYSEAIRNSSTWQLIPTILPFSGFTLTDWVPEFGRQAHRAELALVPSGYPPGRSLWGGLMVTHHVAQLGEDVTVLFSESIALGDGTTELVVNTPQGVQALVEVCLGFELQGEVGLTPQEAVAWGFKSRAVLTGPTAG